MPVLGNNESVPGLVLVLLRCKECWLSWPVLVPLRMRVSMSTACSWENSRDDDELELLDVSMGEISTALVRSLTEVKGEVISRRRTRARQRALRHMPRVPVAWVVGVLIIALISHVRSPHLQSGFPVPISLRAGETAVAIDGSIVRCGSRKTAVIADHLASSLVVLELNRCPILLLPSRWCAR